MFRRFHATPSRIRFKGWTTALIFFCLGAGLPVPTIAQEPAPLPPANGQQLFEKNCGACHSLDLPKSQRLNRANWEWVIGDMVESFGLDWLEENELRAIIDYLSKAYGPDVP
jgi:mono/diheme cytochrome c family protein